VELSRVALDAGAAGITVHPRPDERHIRRTDVTDINNLLRKHYPGREFNIEGYPDERFLTLVEAERPDQVTLVPDDPTQGTSDHGWDILANRDLLTAVIARLHKGGMRVSLFVDPDPAAPALAKSVGADRVEIYTGPYGGAFSPADVEREFGKVVATGRAAEVAGLGLNAGHDLTRDNLPALVKALPNLQEVSIGHAVIADAMMFGLGETVRKFRTAIGDL
jgi:pyridoxine 5-phosphate synthase